MGTRMLHAATAAVLLLAPAIVLVAVFRAEPRIIGAAGTPALTPTAAPAVSPSAAAAADIDPCLVGTWLETSVVYEEKAADGETIRLTGSGSIQTFRADGTLVEDFGGGRTLTGAHRGRRLEFVSAGSLTFAYRARDGILHFTDPAASGTTTLRIDGVQTTTTPLSGNTEPARYTCTATSLRTTTTSYAQELTRTG